MYEPFKFDQLLKEQQWNESFDLNVIAGEQVSTIFTEAYFIGGKKTMVPVVEAFKNLKDLLELSIREQGSKFSPLKFVKSLQFKELEDALRESFGFRNINIYCSNEGYNTRTKTFETEELNCYTYPTWRYPIDGLVTDKGFYDSTHSINTDVVITLGLLQKLTPEECTAVLLHEIGHNLDPALVDIKYVETNALSKYLTDRQGKMNNQERGIIKKKGILCVLGDAIDAIFIFHALSRWLERITFSKEKAIEAIRKRLKQDDEFDRIHNSEAFADNMARMYGFGSQLISASKKMDDVFDKRRKSRITKEKDRQRILAKIMLASIDDVHKTDIHRIYSLIKEYEADLADKDIPAAIKKDIKTDLEEVKAVLNSYLNKKDDFAANINLAILEEIAAADGKKVEDILKAGDDDDKAKGSTSGKKVATESADFYDPLAEVIVEAGRHRHNFVLPKKLQRDLKRRVEQLAKINKQAANKLKSANRSSWSREQITVYNEDKYYGVEPYGFPQDQWEVIDITEIFAKAGETKGKCIRIEQGREQAKNEDVRRTMLMKSHCLGTGIKLTNENFACFMQIMTDDLPDPNVFGRGVKIAQLLVKDWEMYGFKWVTSTTIPANPVPYAKLYHEFKRDRYITAAELRFKSGYMYLPLYDFIDEMIEKGETVKSNGKSIDFGAIKKLAFDARPQCWICEKKVSDKYFFNGANIGGYTSKTQDVNEPCILNVTSALTADLGETIGDYGTAWVDLKGKADWDCF